MLRESKILRILLLKYVQSQCTFAITCIITSGKVIQSVKNLTSRASLGDVMSRLRYDPVIVASRLLTFGVDVPSNKNNRAMKRPKALLSGFADLRL